MHVRAERYLKNLDFKIGGEGIVVEIDDSKFGKGKYNLWHRVDCVFVLGLREITGRRSIIFLPIDKKDKNTLESLVLKFFKFGDIIYSDCWKVYVDLNEHFVHETVNNSGFFIDPVTGVHTNTIEGN